MNVRTMLLLSLLPCLAACRSEAPPQPGPSTPTAPPTTVAPTPVTPPAPSGLRPVDIPAGFGYPGNREEFQTWADEWQIDKITATAWDLWAGMTQDSGQSWNGSALPIWETWCGNEEVFSAAGCSSSERPARAFQAASQIGHSAQKAGAPTPSDGQVVSFNKFNPPMAEYLATAHAGPDAASYSYISMKDLAALNAAWPAGTAVADRKVQDAPYTPDAPGAQGSSAMETKPVIFVVKAKGLTPMPLWMGPEQSTTPANAVPSSWFNCVLLDPANSGEASTLPVPATADQIAQAVPSPDLACKDYLYAPLSTIYHFKMDAAEAADWNALVNQSGDGGQGLQAEAGDYGVLTGMHVNTKTLLNWTWQTYWWQPGADAPNNFPGSKQGMSSKVEGAWRNYAMCTAWNQTQGSQSSEMVVCFNPFLETSSGIPAGQQSNCMSCHGTATVGTLQAGSSPSLATMNYPADYTAPIDFKANACTQPTGSGSPTCFADFTKTDFSWAIPQNALPPPASSP
jgi:hypothetical protein